MRVIVKNERHGHVAEYDVEVQEVYAVNRDNFVDEVKEHIFRYEDVVLIDKEADVILTLISPDRVELMHEIGYKLHTVVDEYGYEIQALGFIYSMFTPYVSFDNVEGEEDDYDYWDDFDDTLPCGYCACCGCTCDAWDWDDEEVTE